MAGPVRWISRSGESRLDFYRIYSDDGKMHVMAELFQRNVESQFDSTKINIDEGNMVVERANLYDLMRGSTQQTSYVSKLHPDQKNALIESLETRTITIERGPCAAFITIHASP